MVIRDDDVAAVRAATDIVALISEHSALRRQGRRWVGLCPFHDEKTPSFSVNGEEGLYYCFGCQARGDAITFVREMEHLDFGDAVRFLAGRAGVTVQEDERATAEHRARAGLLEAMEAAVSWYHDRLLSAPDAGPARQYLRARGYDGTVVRTFRLGWAPDDWDQLCRALGLPAEVMSGAGLGFVNRRGRLQDAFRARVLFPICDPSGRPIAIGGRILPAGPQARPQPKYKNSQESPIYVKRRTLYALNWAKESIVATGEVVVCEGYTDVIGCFQAGVPRAVATCGTALGEDHFRLLRNFGRRIVLAYDADVAGQSAMSRVHEWERRHEVDVVVAALPAGADPGELAARDPDLLRSAIESAQPYLGFQVDRVLSGGDLTTTEGRARTARAALAVVAEHPDPLVRDPYVMVVADRCRLDPERLREQLDPGAGGGTAGGGATNGAPRGRRRPASLRPVGSTSPASDRAGLEALRFLVHRREQIENYLDEVLFTDDVQRRTCTALYDIEAESLSALVEQVRIDDPEVADLLLRLAVEEPTVAKDPVGDPVAAVVAQLVRGALLRELASVQADARGASEGALRAIETDAVTLRRMLLELEEPDAAPSVAERLVAWVFARPHEDG